MPNKRAFRQRGSFLGRVSKRPQDQDPMSKRSEAKLIDHQMREQQEQKRREAVAAAKAQRRAEEEQRHAEEKARALVEAAAAEEASGSADDENIRDARELSRLSKLDVRQETLRQTILRRATEIAESKKKKKRRRKTMKDLAELIEESFR